jgi:Concanavalin A-like lectin/glucanases superfamily/FecR protein
MVDSERDETDAALARFLDGEPEPHDGELLAAAMTDDGEFASEMVRLLMLDELLRQERLPDDQAFLDSLKLRLGVEPGDDDFFDDFKNRVRGTSRKAIGFWRSPWSWAAAAAILVLATVGAFVGGRAWPGTDRSPLLAGRGPEERLLENRRFVRSSRTLAVSTRVVDARWEGTDLHIEEGTSLEPGHLRLAAGLVQLEFLNGASVIIEGPCDFELISNDKAYCHRGKLRAHVPPQARGFTVEAPGYRAVDLGTEFAMRVDERGRGELHVVEGEVELHVAGTNPASSQIKTLRSGSGANFSVDERPREITADSASFVDRSKLIELEGANHRERHRRWLDHSKTLRADPASVLYYSFEDINTWERTLKNVAGSGESSLDGAVVGCVWCPGRWRGKSALEFKRTSDRVRIEVPGDFPQLTLAAWIRIEGVNNWLSSLMLTDDWEPREAHWQITVRGEIILGVMQDDGGGDGHHSPPVIGPELLGHWVHIVTVYDADTNRIIHYLNGSPVSQGALSIPVPLRIGSANIGNWNNARYHDIDAIRSLNGRIDEFAIFRRVLSKEEIKQMYDLGKPSS